VLDINERESLFLDDQTKNISLDNRRKTFSLPTFNAIEEEEETEGRN
jgi:hypothetical protein